MKHLPMTLLLLAACGGAKEPEGIHVVMTNKTGGHLHDFRLAAGGEPIAYQIFSADYTFRKDLAVPKSGALTLSYRRDDGTRVDRALGFTVALQDRGGELRITFGPDGADTFVFRALPDVQPKDDLEANLADARRWYDRIALGTGPEEFERLTGHRPKDGPRDGWAKDFGWSLKPEHVTLEVRFRDAKVVRVALRHSQRGPSKGALVAEKGMSETEAQAK